MHKIKRCVVGGMQARHMPKNAQYENQRKRLDKTERALTHALDSIDAAKHLSVNVAEHNKEFCHGLTSVYPREDDMQTLIKKTMEDTTALEREVKITPDGSSSISAIELHIRAYLTEIKSLKGEYQNVEKSRRDYAMYQHKVDKLERKQAANDKKSRYLELFEGARATYDSVLDGVLHQLNSTLDKAPAVFESAYIAYWLTQGKVHSAMTLYCKPAIEYAIDNESKIVRTVSATKALGT